VPDLEVQQRSPLGIGRIEAASAGRDVIRVALHDGRVTQIVVRLTIDEALTLTAALLAAMSLSFGLAIRRP
jgi:hypothetical protein